MNPWEEHWQRLETSLTALLDTLAPTLDTADLELLRDFVDNREFGIALELLWACIKERSIPLASEQKATIEQLAESMKIKLAD